MKYLKQTKNLNLNDKFIEMLESEDVNNETSVIDLREDYTYGVQTSMKDDAKVKELKQACKEIIDTTKEIIYKK